MEVTESQYNKMKRYARSVAQNPPHYNFAKFNCQSFCNSTLYTAGITLCDFTGYPFDSVVPNYVFDTTKRISNVISYQKIVFVR